MIASQKHSAAVPVGALAEQIARLGANLKPFQSLEYDPETGQIVIITENLVPSHSPGQMVRIVANCEEGEKVLIKRFPDAFKVTIISTLSA
jgi:hypothetical protein